MKEEYILIGFINMFNIIPDFIFPVFLHDKKYYFQSINNNIIDEFIEIKKSVLHKVQKIESVSSNLNGSNLEFKLGSPPIYTFQLEEKRIFCGSLQEILLYFEQYKTGDLILADEIQNFKKENSPYILKEINKNEISTFAYVKTNEKRNNWVAKLILTPGSGKMYVNGEDQDSQNELDQVKKVAWRRPLEVTNKVKKYDFNLLIPEEIDFKTNEGVIRKAILRVLYSTLKQNSRRAGLLSRTPQRYTIIMKSGRCKIRREMLKAKSNRETLKK